MRFWDEYAIGTRKSSNKTIKNREHEKNISIFSVLEQLLPWLVQTEKISKWKSLIGLQIPQQSLTSIKNTIYVGIIVLNEHRLPTYITKGICLLSFFPIQKPRMDYYLPTIHHLWTENGFCPFFFRTKDLPKLDVYL